MNAEGFGTIRSTGEDAIERVGQYESYPVGTFYIFLIDICGVYDIMGIALLES